MHNNRWVIVKFGGTSVSARACWDNITTIVRRHRAAGYAVLVVCSALSGATNSLRELGKLALENQHVAACDRLEAQYLALSASLAVSPESLQSIFSNLRQRLNGVLLLGELTARTQAEILSVGESALTALGAAFLQSQGLAVTEFAATDLLQVTEEQGHHQSKYLSAVCEALPDSALQHKLAQLSEPLVITQGFLAANSQRETVLLGRGGSDVSAAYLAAKLQAELCEIWTDVAGIYSANPRLVAKARVIRTLGYDEAQEIAAMGGKILHPNTLPPLKVAAIPLWVKKTLDPQSPGTLVSSDQTTIQPAIKCISVKKSIVLISIEAVSMWRSSGFLADTFACFKQHNLSVDLVSTAESCITVSLDVTANLLDNQILEHLLSDLNQFAAAMTIGPCAAVSLLGSGIRAILADLSGVLTQFQTHRIYLLSQAANDLNLTFVVDEQQVERLCQQLHHVLIENQPPGEVFASEAQPSVSDSAWWEEAVARLPDFKVTQLPGYFYSEKTILQQVHKLEQIEAINRRFYAVKANPCPAVLSVLANAGIGMECVSQGEIEHVLACLPQLPMEQILFTPNFAPKHEYAYALAQGVWLTLDNAYPLAAWPELFKDRELLLRIDPGQGRGHHKHVMTAGQSAKFGIPIQQLESVMALVAAAGAKVVGLHAHAGSGVLDSGHWLQIATTLAECLAHCPDVRILNCGGGLGITEMPWQEPLDLTCINQGLAAFKLAHPQLELWLEPGRYLVARCGVLLARVTQLKEKAGKIYIGIETGMNSLLRPALYGAYHPIINLSRHAEPLIQEATVVGPICESADVLGYDRLLPKTLEGDIIAIGLVGAYGESMSMDYNHRPPAKGKLWEA